MTDTLITCPHCTGRFPLTETLARPLVEAARTELAAEQERRAADLARRDLQLEEGEARLVAARVEFDQDVAARVAGELASVRASELAKAKAQSATELQALREELQEKRDALTNAQAHELELRRKQRELEQKADDTELVIQRTLDAERQKILQAARQDTAEQQRLKLAEKDQVIAAMKKQIEEAQRTSERTSQQLQGDVQEADLADVLQRAFPRDEIVRTATGQGGADVVQRVRLIHGQECGAILWESKRTKHWSDKWLAKVRDDQRAEGADAAVIVSAALPDGVVHFGERDDVWIASPAFAPLLAALLRQQVLRVSEARVAMEGQHEKAAMLYGYLTGPLFRQRIEGVVESFEAMRVDLDSEKRQFTARWQKREKQIERMLKNTCGLYGDVQGITGASLPELSSDRPALGFGDDGGAAAAPAA